MGDIIAWKGELILASATWTDKDGHMAKFKVVGDTSGPNPFKYFTKRRNGRAGTRFSAAMVDLKTNEALRPEDVPPAELMLAGWTDSSTSGHTVTFWMEPPVPECDGRMFHPLQGFERNVSSFMVALVELDDDDTVIDQGKRTKVEEATKPRQRTPQRLSQAAAMMCNNRDFREWIVRDEPGHPLLPDAAEWMRKELRITSRAQLDTDPDVADRFHEKIRKPFATWQENEPGRNHNQNGRGGYF